MTPVRTSFFYETASSLFDFYGYLGDLAARLIFCGACSGHSDLQFIGAFPEFLLYGYLACFGIHLEVFLVLLLGNTQKLVSHLALILAYRNSLRPLDRLILLLQLCVLDFYGLSRDSKCLCLLFQLADGFCLSMSADLAVSLLQACCGIRSFFDYTPFAELMWLLAGF